MASNYSSSNTAPRSATFGGGQQHSLRNHLLIAMPGMPHSIFSHSVTYICDHSEHGAMGIIISQTLDITLGDVFDQLALRHGADSAHTPILAGGPVNMQQGFVLHRNEGQWESTIKVTDEICLTASRDVVIAIAANRGPRGAQFALGYAGWSPGQLEEEISNNAWLTLPADTAIIFDVPVEQRWAAAANRLGIDINLLPTYAGHA